MNRKIEITDTDTFRRGSASGARNTCGPEFLAGLLDRTARMKRNDDETQEEEIQREQVKNGQTNLADIEVGYRGEKEPEQGCQSGISICTLLECRLFILRELSHEDWGLLAMTMKLR